MVSFLRVCCLLLFVALPLASCQNALLYVWSGNLSGGPDFVNVVDYTVGSQTYGSVINTISLEDSDTIVAANNEPHHSGIANDRSLFMTGGLLSFLQGKAQVFIWDIPPTDPSNPVLRQGVAPEAGCTDDFYPLGDNGLLFSQMCASDATSPGEIVYIDTEGIPKSLLDTQNQNPLNIQNFNPHGLEINNDGVLTVGDYIVPASLLASSADQIVLRNTVREFVFNEDDLSLYPKQVYDSPPNPPQPDQLGSGNGFMDVRTIPGDKRGRFFTPGTSDSHLYLVDPKAETMTPILDLRDVVNDPNYQFSACLMRVLPNGKRLLLTFELRYVILLDISKPEAPVALQTFDFCEDTTHPVPVFGQGEKTFAQFCAENTNMVGTHAVMNSEAYFKVKDLRFTIVNYFLKFGLAQFGATRSIHSFTLDKQMNSFVWDEDFNPNPQLVDLAASPHSVIYVPLNEDGSVNLDVKPYYDHSFSSSSSCGPFGWVMVVVSLYYFFN